MKPWWKDPVCLIGIAIIVPFSAAIVFMTGYMLLFSIIQMIHAGWNGP